MPTYVNAATVRIQQYLGRTPKLRLRRGASWMISRATQDAQVEAWIRRSGLVGAQVNQEAGRVDGVISLVVPEGEGPRLTQQLLMYLRTQMPGAEFEGQWSSGASYLDALAVAGTVDGLSSRDSLVALPPLADFPLAVTCEYCRVDVRVSARRGCADCEARQDAAGSRGNLTRPGLEALGTEKRLLDAVNLTMGRTSGRELAICVELEELATFGALDGNRNHLATIALDGNALGSFFTDLARIGSVTLKQQISPALSEATFSALVAATCAVTTDEDSVLPVVPHIIGGDDVLVSVIADRAWDFVLCFLDAFTRELAGRTQELGMPEEIILPTMSAGVVFAQSSFPFARLVHLAETVLRHAKNSSGPGQSAASWLDVTVEGEQLPDWRRAINRRGLEEQRSTIAELASISPSGRQRLARILSAESGYEVEAEVYVWARRNGAGFVPKLLGAMDVTTVRNLVALTKWWRG